jgi:hypothetical protein
MKATDRETIRQLQGCVQIGFVILIGCLAASCANACSFVLEAFTGVAPEEYVFYGEVTGYASIRIGRCEETAHADQCHESWGLKLKIVAPLQVPDRSAHAVNLFWFGLGSMCNRETVSQAQVSQIPIGSKFKIAAKPVEHAYGDGQTPSLDASDWTGALAIQLPRASNLRAQARSRFDYKCFWQEGSSDRHFEIRKDLLRLKRSNSDREAAEILMRLAECGHHEGTRAASNRTGNFLESLIEQYLRDEKWVDAVRRRRAAYESLMDDDPSSSGETWLTLQGEPYFRGIRALRLIEEGFIVESIEPLESAARQGYLPAKLHLARAMAMLADVLRELDPPLAQSYAAKSSGTFQQVLHTARQLSGEGDAMAMLILATMYREREAGLTLGSGEADRLECLAMKTPPPDRIPGLGREETLNEAIRCSVVLDGKVKS